MDSTSSTCVVLDFDCATSAGSLGDVRSSQESSVVIMDFSEAKSSSADSSTLIIPFEESSALDMGKSLSDSTIKPSCTSTPLTKNPALSITAASKQLTFDDRKFTGTKSSNLLYNLSYITFPEHSLCAQFVTVSARDTYCSILGSSPFAERKFPVRNQ